MRFRANVTVFLASLVAVTGPFAAGQEPPNREGREIRKSPVVKVVERCRGAVVDFVSQHSQGERWQLHEFFTLEPNEAERAPQLSQGAGFIVHPSGYILTNAHVVDRTIIHQVVLADGRTLPADVVAVDAGHDLALVKVESPTVLEAATLALPDDVMVGETAIAIGNPHGLSHTCSVGIISAVGREISTERGPLGKVLQLDVPINPGNSGGPIFNILGEVLGVSVSKRSDSDNIAFAIPIARARTVLANMLESERRFGLETGLRFTDDLLSTKIASVAEDSPAAAARLKADDIVTRGRNRVLDTRSDRELALIDATPGDPIDLEVRRGEETLKMQLTPAARPLPDGGKLLFDLLGFKALPLSRERAKEMLLRSERALIVTEVTPGKYTDNPSPEPGDVIARIGLMRPTQLKDAAFTLSPLKKGDKLSVVLLRKRGDQVTRIDVNVQLN
jgi:serine protease Do